MKIGLQIPDWTWAKSPAEVQGKLVEIAQAADAAGFASIWVLDHLFQMPHVGPPEEFMPEAYTTLGFLAGVTQAARLGVMVTGVIYRYPGILVKTMTTLDVLSGGRSYFGIGAAWFEREAHALGIPFPPLSERFEWLEETLQITHQMWSGEVKPYTGKHFTLQETLSVPLPISHPRPPIMIGGGGERKTLRMVAQYGDACNIDVEVGYDGLRHKYAVLKDHCTAVGRDYNEIERTAVGRIHFGEQSTDEIIAHCRALADAGVQQMIFAMPNVTDTEMLTRFGREIIPALAAF